MLDDDDDPLEESGWKLIHGDVFRQPNQVQRLTSVVGAGIQLLISSGIVILLTSLGIVRTNEYGSITSISIISYIASAPFGSFVSSYFFHTYGTTLWRSNIRTTFMAFTVPVYIAFAISQRIFSSNRFCSSALALQSFFTFSFFFVIVGFALSYTGALVGLSIKALQPPTRVNQLPRQIQPQPKYLSTLAMCLIGGAVTFFSFALQFRLILQSFWLNASYYFSFRLLFFVFCAMLLTSCEISVLFVYLRLAHENYNWWWPSVLVPAASGVFAFLFSIYFLFFEYAPIGTASYVLYILFSLIVSYGIALLNGSVGFLVSYVFVSLIFSEIKME